MGQDVTLKFDSIDHLAQEAQKLVSDGKFKMRSVDKYDDDWYGSEVRNFADVRELSRTGWVKELPAAMSIVERAIETVEREHDAETFAPIWDVQGCEVDVARYLDGEPENMIDYHLAPTTKVGRVITLCASITYSGAVSEDGIKRRGHSIAALSFALTRLGYQVELWADMSIADGSMNRKWRGMLGDPENFCRCRVLVKGANDELDHAKIMYGYAHPSMFRVLGFAGFNMHSESLKQEVGVPHGGYGYPCPPAEDLDEGTIYLPEVISDMDIPNADQLVTHYLTEIGILDTAQNV